MATTVSGLVYRTTMATPALSLVNGDTLNLVAGGMLVAVGTGSSHGVLAAGSNTFNISGDIFSAHASGIGVTAGGNAFNILAGATIFGGGGPAIVITGASNALTNAGNIGSGTGAGVRCTAGSVTLINSGTIISAANDGVSIDGGNISITNSGHIEGSVASAVQLNGDNNTLVNTGTLRGGTEAVDFDGLGGINAFFNAGTVISTGPTGFDGGEGRDLVTNNGLIQGVVAAVDLGLGNDVYDGRSGTVVGAVLGGDGDDVIYGGTGGETINGGNNNDQIFGGGGADTIIGGAGIDLILGGAGGDVLQGGLGVDLFGFNVGDNGDLIQAFNESGVRDGFDLRGYFNATGYTGTTPRAAGIMQVLQNGADTDVYLHGAFAFRIQGIVAAAIDDTYFLFQ